MHGLLFEMGVRGRHAYAIDMFPMVICVNGIGMGVYYIIVLAY
jgi:hypothetical protein